MKQLQLFEAKVMQSTNSIALPKEAKSSSHTVTLQRKNSIREQKVGTPLRMETLSSMAGAGYLVMAICGL
ncbi:hypothetical protein Tco_0484088 [Tanacetum coccineum]